MSGLTLTIDPAGLNVQEIPGPPDDEGNPTVAAVVLQIHTPVMGFAIGPFEPESWEQFKAYLADPAGESEKQRVRERILIANGGTEPPKMSVPKG